MEGKNEIIKVPINPKVEKEENRNKNQIGQVEKTSKTVGFNQTTLIIGINTPMK